MLIPRPETELLVEQALAWCRANPRDRYDLLDVGTGSGCIAIAICKRNPTIHAIASDISGVALKVAADNIRRHELTDRIRTVEADLLDLPKDAVPPDGFDLIVSNPPYIADVDREQLPENVRKYEPAIALFAGVVSTRFDVSPPMHLATSNRVDYCSSKLAWARQMRLKGSLLPQASIPQVGTKTYMGSSGR